MAEAAVLQSLTINGGLDLDAFVKLYMFREHRDARSVDCTVAMRHVNLRTSRRRLRRESREQPDRAFQLQGTTVGALDQNEVREKMINTFAHVVGELVLSRACPDDSPLADEILEVCRKRILTTLQPKEEG